MENENRKEKNAEHEEHTFEPLPSIDRGEDITLRDDLYDFSVLLDAVKLARLLRGIRCKINLIPFNEHPWLKFRRPDVETTLKFQKVLTNNHYTALIRESRGSDISAACGQLYGTKERLKWS